MLSIDRYLYEVGLSGHNPLTILNKIGGLTTACLIKVFILF